MNDQKIIELIRSGKDGKALAGRFSVTTRPI